MTDEIDPFPDTGVFIWAMVIGFAAGLISPIIGEERTCRILLSHSYADETERYGVEPVCTICGHERKQ